MDIIIYILFLIILIYLLKLNMYEEFILKTSIFNKKKYFLHTIIYVPILF